MALIRSIRLAYRDPATTPVRKLNPVSEAEAEQLIAAGEEVEIDRETGEQWHVTYSPLAEGDVVRGGNICQAIAGTPLPRAEYYGLNLMNCAPAAGSRVEDCNTCQKSLCYHLHVDRDPETGEITRNPLGLPEEPEDCQHVVGVVEIDGVSIYRREDVALASVPDTAEEWI